MPIFSRTKCKEAAVLPKNLFEIFNPLFSQCIVLVQQMAFFIHLRNSAEIMSIAEQYAPINTILWHPGIPLSGTYYLVMTLMLTVMPATTSPSVPSSNGNEIPSLLTHENRICEEIILYQTFLHVIRVLPFEEQLVA